MGKHRNKGLHIDLWPEGDKLAWGRAFRPGSLLKQGAGHRLSAASKQGLMYSHGLILGFLQSHHPERLQLSIPERLTRNVIAHFIQVASASCRDTTIGSILCREYMALKLMAPDTDWSWLERIQARARKRGISIKHRQITSLELSAVGQSLMGWASMQVDNSGSVSVAAAERYRDGLMIKVLATYPMRRAGFAMLEIGKTLVRIGDQWCIRLPPELVKTREAQEYVLSDTITAEMDEYLERFRPTFPNADAHNWLWPYKDRQMGDKMVRRYICKRTEEALGHAVTPHRFRNAAATFISIADPENVRVAKDLLGHKTFAMTEKHYIDGAQSRLAGHEMSNLIAKMIDREGCYDASA